MFIIMIGLILYLHFVFFLLIYLLTDLLKEIVAVSFGLAISRLILIDSRPIYDCSNSAILHMSATS
jgi:hypothetical protein